MLKKNLLLAILIVFSFVVLGGAVFYNNSLKKQTTNGSPAPDPIGDPQPQSTDYEEVAPPQQPVETEKIEEADGSAPTAPNAPRTAAALKLQMARQVLPQAGPASPGTQSGGRVLSTQSGGTDPLRSLIEQYTSPGCIHGLQARGRLYGWLRAPCAYRVCHNSQPDANITTLIECFIRWKSTEAECDSQFYSILRHSRAN